MTDTDVYRQICDLIPTLDGWCSTERACKLAQLVIDEKPDVSVCLGVWGGRDTFALALAHRCVGHGYCLAVDPWKAEASVVGQKGENEIWWGDQKMHDLVRGRFEANMHALGLEEWIHVRHTTAALAVAPGSIGILVVDANHGPDSVSDVQKWAPLVVPKGYVYCDDLNWDGGYVQQAVTKLISFGFKKLYEQDTGAFFQRVAVTGKKAKR